MPLAMPSEPFPWTCPSCSTRTTIAKSNVTTHKMSLVTTVGLEQKIGVMVMGRMIHCPAPECNEIWVAVSADKGQAENYGGRPMLSAPPDGWEALGVGEFIFYPAASAPLSASAPRGVQEDYREASLIRSLSPKASATLARRALQGMIRDFWGVSKRTLAEEIKAVKDECDPGLYEAMMALKAVGNIGAHPEKDVDQIIEVDPDEADELLGLLQILDHEWYVAREMKQRRIASIISLGQSKKDVKTSIREAAVQGRDTSSAS